MQYLIKYGISKYFESVSYMSGGTEIVYIVKFVLKCLQIICLSLFFLISYLHPGLFNKINYSQNKFCEQWNYWQGILSLITAISIEVVYQTSHCSLVRVHSMGLGWIRQPAEDIEELVGSSVVTHPLSFHPKWHPTECLNLGLLDLQSKPRPKPYPTFQNCHSLGQFHSCSSAPPEHTNARLPRHHQPVRTPIRGRPRKAFVKTATCWSLALCVVFMVLLNPKAVGCCTWWLCSLSLSHRGCGTFKSTSVDRKQCIPLMFVCVCVCGKWTLHSYLWDVIRPHGPDIL